MADDTYQWIVWVICWFWNEDERLRFCSRGQPWPLVVRRSRSLIDLIADGKYPAACRHQMQSVRDPYLTKFWKNPVVFNAVKGGPWSIGWVNVNERGSSKRALILSFSIDNPVMHA